MSSYNWGSYSEAIVSEYFEPIHKDDTWPWWGYTIYEGTEVVGTEMQYYANVTIQLRERNSIAAYSSPSTIYGSGNVSVVNIINIFDDFFPSFYTTESTSATPLLRYKNYFDGPWTQELHFNPWQAPNDITHFIKRLATSMTNLLRSSVNKEMVEGSAYSKRSFIYISWAWLAFPFALLMLSLAFLVCTMIKTSKDTAVGMWKTSAMPTLVCGLPEETREKFAAQSAWNSSHGDAKKVRIKLLPNLGWRVSGQNLLKSPLLPVRKNQAPPGWF